MKRIVYMLVAALIFAGSVSPASAASELVEYVIDPAAYDDAAAMFKAVGARLRSQNTSGGGHIYEISDGMLHASNTENIGTAHVCMDFFGNWQQTSDEYSKLHLSFSMSADDVGVSKNFLARFYHYNAGGQRTSIKDDTIIDFASDGNMKCQMGTIGEYTPGTVYKFDYIVDMQTGYRRLYVDGALAFEGTDSGIAPQAGGYVIYNNSRIQYGPKKVGSTYEVTGYRLGKLSYRYYDSCSRFIDTEPYVEEDYINLKNPVFAAGTSTTEDASDVFYDADSISLEIDGALSEELAADMFLLKSDTQTARITGVSVSGGRLILHFEPLASSKADWRLTVLDSLLLKNGKKSGKSFEFDFRTGAKPFDILSVSFSKTGALAAGDEVDAEVKFNNTEGAAREVVIVARLIDSDGRTSALCAKTVRIDTNGQCESIAAPVAVSAGQSISLFVLNGWSNPISIDNIEYTSLQ